MAKIHQNNIRSLVLDRGSHTSTAGGASGNHFRLWTAFSGAAFRRKIFDAVSCGGSSRYRCEFTEDEDDSTAKNGEVAKSGDSKNVIENKRGTQNQRREKQQEKTGNPRSEKLLDLLNLAETEAETEREVKKKEEALEELKQVAKGLQVVDEVKRREAASKVRLLAKEDSETRVTLAMLGAIPPLVGMLDFENVESQIAALYALLNLGIGNDA